MSYLPLKIANVNKRDFKQYFVSMYELNQIQSDLQMRTNCKQSAAKSYFENGCN